MLILIYFLQLVAFEQRIVKLREILQQLPDDHYTLLETLFSFLVLVATKHQVETKMGTENLSIVIGPNIILNRERTSGTDMEVTSVVVTACSLMIDNYSQIFKVCCNYCFFCDKIFSNNKKKNNKRIPQHLTQALKAMQTWLQSK